MFSAPNGPDATAVESFQPDGTAPWVPALSKSPLISRFALAAAGHAAAAARAVISRPIRLIPDIPSPVSHSPLTRRANAEPRSPSVVARSDLVQCDRHEVSGRTSPVTWTSAN